PLGRTLAMARRNSPPRPPSARGALQHRATLTRPLGRGADSVRQRGFAHVRLEPRRLRAPGREARPESVSGDVAAPHPLAEESARCARDSGLPPPASRASGRALPWDITGTPATIKGQKPNKIKAFETV